MARPVPDKLMAEMETFNAKVPVGGQVRVAMDRGTVWGTTTTSPAYVLNQRVVVAVDGGDIYALDRVTPGGFKGEAR